MKIPNQLVSAVNERRALRKLFYVVEQHGAASVKGIPILNPVNFNWLLSTRDSEKEYIFRFCRLVFLLKSRSIATTSDRTSGARGRQFEQFVPFLI